MPERHGIIVGIDGSPGSISAARWAMAHTAQFGPVRPVCTWSIPALAMAGTPLGYAPPPPADEMQAATVEFAESFVADLGLDPASLEVVSGDPGVVLCDMAEDANVLVVGTRSRGPLTANLLGSVGRYCADHSPIPLVIVPADHDASAPDEIVVGVDGSPNAHDALRWAAIHAGDAPITAISSWQTPIDGPVMFGGGRFDLRAFRANATTIVEDAVAKVAADLGLEPGGITRIVREGDPRRTLDDAVNERSMLVVGRRGRGGIAHLLLGSTTTSLIHRPRCPIAVIPPEHDHD